MGGHQKQDGAGHVQADAAVPEAAVQAAADRQTARGHPRVARRDRPVHAGQELYQGMDGIGDVGRYG